MTDLPMLTQTRWAALIALKSSRALQSRPFLARELNYAGGRHGQVVAGHGATMASLAEAGWLEAVVVGKKGDGMPFRSGGAGRAWQLTEAGRIAVAACPDTFPGGPVYGKNAK